MQKIIIVFSYISFLLLSLASCASKETEYSSSALRERTPPHIWYSYFEPQVFGEEQVKVSSEAVQ